MSDEGLEEKKGGEGRGLVGKKFYFSKVLSCLQSGVCRGGCLDTFAVVIRMGF